MLHTFELKHKTTTRLIRELEDELCQSLIHPTNNTVELLNPLFTPGIRKLSVSNSRKGSCYITLEIEPQALLNKQLTVDLYACTPTNNEELVSILSKHIEGLQGGLPSLQDGWYMSRIDYAMQSHTDHTTAYVQLARKSKAPYHYEDKIKKQGSMYFQSKSTRYNFYDKHDYMKKQNMPQSLIDSSDGLFRVEVQYRTTKAVKHLRNKYQAYELFDLFAPEVALDVLSTAYSRTVGLEDFHSYDQARLSIINSTANDSMKSKLLKLLEFIGTVSNLREATELIDKNSNSSPDYYRSNRQLFNHHLKKLRAIGVNPILISTESEQNKLANPFTILAHTICKGS